MPRILLLIAAVLYALACITPWFWEIVPIHRIVFGWMDLETIPWAANPIAARGILLLDQDCNLAAGIAGVLALWLGLSRVLLFPFTPSVGYFLWMASFAVFTASALVEYLRARGARSVNGTEPQHAPPAEPLHRQ